MAFVFINMTGAERLKQDMAGIKDVAKRAGVGVGTVSRMLNESGYVSAEAREKIQKAMTELSYTPNELARNLYHKKSGIIAVLVPSVSNPYFAEFVECVEAELHERGFKTMLCSTAKDANAESEYLDMLNRHIVDGVITGVHTLDIDEYIRIQKPIVALDRFLGEDIPVVAADHVSGGRMAAKLLIENGCRNVLHFRGATQVDSPYHDRHTEFARVMKEQGIECHDYELEWNRFESEYYSQAVEDAFNDVFSKGIEFDGIFGVDHLAINCINELRKRNKCIPEDIRIVGYDGTFLSRMVSPRLTTIAQPIGRLAKESAILVSEMADGKKYKNKRVILDVELCQGETTYCNM